MRGLRVLTISSTAAASYALNGWLALELAPPGFMLPDSRALNFRLRKLLLGCDLPQRRVVNRYRKKKPDKSLRSKEKLTPAALGHKLLAASSSHLQKVLSRCPRLMLKPTLTLMIQSSMLSYCCSKIARSIRCWVASRRSIRILMALTPTLLPG